MKKVQGKKKKSKTSAVKLSNKHLNKLGKQGKLKQEALRKKVKQKKLEKFKNKRIGNERNGTASNIHTAEEILEEDANFYSNSDLKKRFMSAISSR